MNTDRFRVLAVDDDPDILELVRMSLESELDVVALTDPGRALDYMDYIEPDIAVLDIMMPRITGYHIVESMRKSTSHKGVPIIFLTAKNSPHDMRYGYRVGANYYLTKPFNPDRLLRTIHLVIADGGMQLFRRKTWALAEVRARLDKRIPQTYTSWQEFQNEREKILGKDQLKLHRLLSEDRHKDKDGWQG